MRTCSILLAMAMAAGPADSAGVAGELKKWHKVTLSFDGPSTSEAATPNPFTDYRLDVTFRHAASGKTYRVPGHYAADGNAADTSAAAGSVWRVHFAPDETGNWTYQASFRSGSNIATGTGAGSSAGFFDGETGSFSIQATDKGGRDLRGKGRLQYVGKHHLRFAETGEFFMKAGVDAPENFLAYEDFDGDFKADGRDDDLVKDWGPHVGDWDAGDPVWQDGKGKGIIGAINYLASEGLNVFSFLTMNINGDDNNVFPYLIFGERLRLDVSRLDQWEIVFEHGTRKGMYLHFKTQETENELLLDGGDLGNQRKLYYRELVSRFGHHLALNWNLGEEINDASTLQKVAWAGYFRDIDPYRHHIVIHNGDSHYELMGDASDLTGFSRQENAEDFSDTFADIKNYVDRSADAGKPWVVACDEPGDSRLSLRPDDDAGSSHLNARRDALWATAMAGGAGIEFYFGYDKPHSDLTCNDFRSRDGFWDYCRHFLQFFDHPDVSFENMTNRNSLVSGSGDNGNRCLGQDGVAYVVQLRSGGSHTLNLGNASGSFRVRWFDPRNGGSFSDGPAFSGGGTRSLGSPPSSTSEDWIALVTRDDGGTPDNEAPVASAGPDRAATLSGADVSVSLAGSVSDDGLPAGSTLTSAWTRLSGPAAVTFANASSPATTATFTEAGSYLLRLTASDGSLGDADDVAVVVSSSSGGGEGSLFFPTDDAYTENGANRNNDGLRVENASRVRVSYLRFDLSALSGAPASATLRFTEYHDDSPTALTLRLFAGTSSSWTESSLSGSTAPAKGAEIDVVSQAVNNGDAVEFDVAPAISGPGIYTFILETDPTYRDVSFGSKENDDPALRPVLMIGGTGTANAAPVADAGQDVSAMLNGSFVDVALAGEVADDGLPSGSAVSHSWSQAGGPGDATIASPGSLQTSVRFTATGSYVLRLSASDGELSDSDEVVVNITAGDPGGESQSFVPTHDCYLQDGRNVNDGQLRVESSSSRHRVIYLQFDLRGIPAAPQSVLLRLKEHDDVSSGQMTLRVHAGTSSDWTESDLASGNAPAKGDPLDSFTGTIGNGDTVEFDVSAAVTAPGIYSFIVEADASALDVAFASSENSAAGDRPGLTVVYPSAAAGIASFSAEPGGSSPPVPRLSMAVAGKVQLEMVGVPGRGYLLQRSADLKEWHDLGLVMADRQGAVVFVDLQPLPGRAFYRFSD